MDRGCSDITFFSDYANIFFLSSILSNKDSTSNDAKKEQVNHVTFQNNKNNHFNAYNLNQNKQTNDYISSSYSNVKKSVFVRYEKSDIVHNNLNDTHHKREDYTKSKSDTQVKKRHSISHQNPGTIVTDMINNMNDIAKYFFTAPSLLAATVFGSLPQNASRLVRLIALIKVESFESVPGSRCCRLRNMQISHWNRTIRRSPSLAMRHLSLSSFTVRSKPSSSYGLSIGYSMSISTLYHFPHHTP